MSSPIDYSKESDDAAEQRQRALRELMWVTLVVAVYFFGFGAYRFSLGNPNDVIISIIDACAGLLLLANLASKPLHKETVTMSAIGMVIVNIALIAIIPFSTASDMPIFWLFAFPAAAFVLNGLRIGLVVNGIFCLSIATLSLLQHQGLVQTPYSTGMFWKMWWALGIIILLGIVSQNSREKAQASIASHQERLDTLLRHLPGGVLMADRSGAILTTNAGMDRLLGQHIDPSSSAEEFPSRYRLEQQDGKICPPEAFPLAVVLAGHADEVRNIVFVGNADGARTAIRITAAPTRDRTGKVVGAVAVFEDATKEHEIEEMKSELVSFASHQLKTPLTSIRWTNESLLSGDFGAVPAKLKAPIKETVATIDRLMRLVSDILSVSRIETGRKFDVVRKPTDVTPIIAEIVKGLDLAAAQRNVTIIASSLPEPLLLDVDGGKFRELFLNLVSNAVKYSRTDGKVDIELARTEQDSVTLSVIDDGVGIPQSQQDRIFQRFFRADNVSQEIEGTGLGLYIAKVIVDRHGGRIWFDSKEGKGATFYVTLPLAKK